MITELTRDQVVEIGARNKAGNLLEQAGYTLGLAKLDGDELAELMEPGYLDEAKLWSRGERLTAKIENMLGYTKVKFPHPCAPRH